MSVYMVVTNNMHQGSYEPAREKEGLVLVGIPQDLHCRLKLLRGTSRSDP